MIDNLIKSIAGQKSINSIKMLSNICEVVRYCLVQALFPLLAGFKSKTYVFQEWLSPLPDNSLPHIMIRKQFLRLLSEVILLVFFIVVWFDLK